MWKFGLNTSWSISWKMHYWLWYTTSISYVCCVHLISNNECFSHTHTQISHGLFNFFIKKKNRDFLSMKFRVVYLTSKHFISFCHISYYDRLFINLSISCTIMKNHLFIVNAIDISAEKYQCCFLSGPGTNLKITFIYSVKRLIIFVMIN